LPQKSGNGGEEVDYPQKLALLAAKEDVLYGKLKSALDARVLMELATLRERNRWLLKETEKMAKVRQVME
jgi:hypothetical protein